MRALDDYARGVLDSALLRSATVRQLAGQLDGSDVIALVQVSSVPTRTATTSLLNGKGTLRYLLVSLHPGQSPNTLMELLGHELQHVREIAAAPEVRTVDALSALYRRIGITQLPRDGRFDKFETEEARTVERKVRRDLATRPKKPETVVVRRQD